MLLFLFSFFCLDFCLFCKGEVSIDIKIPTEVVI